MTTLRRSGPVVVLVLGLVYAAGLGAVGIDFGHHWDEGKLTGSARGAIRAGLLLPGWYNYPSVPFDLVTTTGLVRTVLRAPPWEVGRDRFQAVADEYLATEAFRADARLVFLCISLLSGVGVYALVVGLAGARWPATAAAVGHVTAFEFLYHARWIAPDALLAAFVILSLAAQRRMLAAEGRAPVRRWSMAAAVLAGLAVGTKYTGGIVLVPLLLALVQRARTDGSGIVEAGTRLGRTLLIVGLTFAVTTPGAWLQPWRFVNDVAFEMTHYARGHAGFTVTPGADHFSGLWQYVLLVAPSPSRLLSLGVSIVAAVGAAHLFRRRRFDGIWLLSIPVLFSLYMSGQSVMIARNYLLLLPIMAILAGLGIHVLAHARHARLARSAVVILVVAALGYNLWHATDSAVSIHRSSEFSREKLRARRQAAIEERIRTRGGEVFYLSRKVRRIVGPGSARRFDNVTTGLDEATRLIFLSKEVEDLDHYAANRPGRYRTVYTRRREVNWDYYPTWLGYERVLEVDSGAPALSELVDSLELPRPRQRE